MAALTVASPCLSRSWVSRRSPTESAPIWARMSPMRSSGTRILASTICKMSSSSTPRRCSLTGGSLSPSCWISVAWEGKPPGTMPPVSGQWPVLER